mgnify:CR=1 FL=1
MNERNAIHQRAKLSIGQKGATDEVVVELIALVKKYGTVKVKSLPCAYGTTDRKTSFEQIAKKSGLHLVDVRGNTAVFSK